MVPLKRMLSDGIFQQVGVALGSLVHDGFPLTAIGRRHTNG